MKFNRLFLSVSITAALAGCGADDQAYDTLAKPESLTSKSSIKTDQVYLYMPSMAKAPQYAVSMAPFMQGQEKLVTLSFEYSNQTDDKGDLQVRMLSPDVISQGEIDQGELGRWFDTQSSERPVLEIPVKFVDYQCREDSYGDCTNVEEKVNNDEVPIGDRRFIVPEFEKVVVQENSWNDLFSFASGCYSKTGSSKLATDSLSGWKGYEVTEDGVINFEVETTYKVANNWRCMINGLVQSGFDMSDLSFTVSSFYSLVPLDLVRSKTYEPIVYMKGDEDTFGFFASEVGRPDPSYVGGEFDQGFEYLHRFNPDLEYVDYHLSDSFDQNEETLFFKRVTQDVVDRVNPQLEKVGAPQIRLHEPSGKQSGDLRYNVVNLIDEPLDNGLAGYGPSAVNPVTGEIVHAHVNQYSGVLRSISYWLWDRIVDDYNAGRVEQIVATTTSPVQAPVIASANQSDVAVSIVSEKSIDAEEINQFDLTSNYEEPALKTESFQELILAVQEELLVAEDEATYEDMAALQALETRLWQENNMYPVSSLRSGATFKALPTTIGGMTFNWKSNELWNGTVGEAGNLKKWAELDEAQQEELSLFLVGVFYAKTLVHEFGHNFGLRHNFKGSNDAPNYFDSSELVEHGLKTVPGYSSIMDYNPSLLNALPVFGPYDLAALRFGYKREVEAEKVSVDNGVQTSESVFLNTSSYDRELRNAVLDPYTQPADLVSDGVIKGIAADNPSTPLRSYEYCTDGNVSLNDNCNRHDEGRNRSEIMDFKLESYDDRYYARTVRGMSDNFSESTAMSYALRRITQFNDWRNSLHMYDLYQNNVFINPPSDIQMLGFPVSFTAFCEDDANATQWPFAAYCGVPLAVDKARDQLVDILLTPDHTCELEDATGNISYRKLADIIGNYSDRMNFPVNYVPTSCYDETVTTTLGSGLTVVGEVGKYLNSGKAPRPAPVNNYSNYIDYIGHWPDKLAAAATLTARIGDRRSTERSTKTLLELPEVYGLDQGFYQFYPKGTLLLDSIILGTETLYLNFKDENGAYHKAKGDFKAFSWDETLERMPLYGSFSVRKYYGLPHFEETPLNRAILNAMVMRAVVENVDARDTAFARSISMRSERPTSDEVRTFVRSNGLTYFADASNTYAWNMIQFTNEFKAMLAAKSAGTDLATVEVTTFTLEEFNDPESFAKLSHQYQYQLASLENLPVFDSVWDYLVKNAIN
ncbi:MoxR-like ATPase [Grimontia indica]|uniref:MoxR-like ATPase n=1 Tax=Grimontia indica TaxID=1056512 RepID=R1GLR7_9GAMM|nr:zinc-dependent metalloprotease [Grimontia indica]EOD77014.1 MoxR-like ATPase [Grimontia indica]